MNTTKILLVGLLLVGASLGSFYVGYSINPAVLGPYIAPNAVEGVPEGAVQIIGVVVRQEDNMLTVRLNTGEERTVMLTDETSVVVDVVATDYSALIPGTEIIVSALTQADGSLSTEYVTVLAE